MTCCARIRQRQQDAHGWKKGGCRTCCPSTGDFLRKSAMTTKILPHDATIFSCVWQAPPPLIRFSSSSACTKHSKNEMRCHCNLLSDEHRTSSAPSTQKSSSAHWSKVVSFSPLSTISCCAWNPVGTHTTSRLSAFTLCAGGRGGRERGGMTLVKLPKGNYESRNAQETTLHTQPFDGIHDSRTTAYSDPLCFWLCEKKCLLQPPTIPQLGTQSHAICRADIP